MRRFTAFLARRRVLGLLVVVATVVAATSAVTSVAVRLFGDGARGPASAGVGVALLALTGGWLWWMVHAGRRNLVDAASSEPRIVPASAPASRAVRRVAARYASRGFTEHGAWTVVPHPPHPLADQNVVILVDPTRTIIACAGSTCLATYSVLDDDTHVITTSLRTDVSPTRTIVQSVHPHVDTVLEEHRDALEILGGQGRAARAVEHPELVVLEVERRARAYVAGPGGADLVRRATLAGLGPRRARTLRNGRARVVA